MIRSSRGVGTCVCVCLGVPQEGPWVYTSVKSRTLEYVQHPELGVLRTFILLILVFLSSKKFTGAQRWTVKLVEDVELVQDSYFKSPRVNVRRGNQEE